MSDKIKKILQTPEVPDELKPENIPSLIKRNNIKHDKKRNIKVIRYVSALTACAVIAVCAVNFIPQKNDILYQTETPANQSSADNMVSDENSESISENLYFTNIKNYDEIYNQMKKNYIVEKNNNKPSLWDKLFGSKTYNEYTNGVAVDGATDDNTQYNMAEEEVSEDTATGASENTDVYDTLQQVEGIAEADIIKANANCIFFVIQNTNQFISVQFDNTNGTFGNKTIIDVDNNDYIEEMYLTGDILTVIANNYDYDNYYTSDSNTEVLTYDVSGNSPELINTYCQSGYYSDSRMIDNILYLTTNQSNYYGNIIDEEEYRQYIPTCGNSYDDMKCIDTDDIYIPNDWDNTSTSVEYVNISGIDINNLSEPVSIVSIAGYNGEMYCSNDNIYITQSDYSNGSDNTAITRFSLDNGIINPQSSGTVSGYVLNQFSMDEYNGYFRIATTSNNTVYYEETFDGETNVVASQLPANRSNNIFVLDMDMNTVGSITGMAETESIKSVTFKGDIGYVVTYEQTDPLFAIDFSDPINPVVTDEFKINGYSSFLYNWSDDLLLGFGIDADENGFEKGVKLVMFDVSDNGDLNQCGMYKISNEYAHGIISQAVYERKALLLDSTKNIIGFPLTEYINNYPINSYRLFSYDNGEFTEIGAVYSEDEYNSEFIRAVYIGNYICMFSYDEAICAELTNMNVTDKISLD